jgi:pimeloyl-ACP methyl ester carboxylesterase
MLRATVVGLALLGVACAPPVGTVRVAPDIVHRTLAGSVLSIGTPSIATENVVEEQNLADRFDDQPEAALAELHRLVATGQRGPNVIFALAELSFLHAERSGNRSYYLASAVYAYAFLFPDDEASAPDPFDTRLRLAADLYNRGVTKGFASDDGAEVVLRQGVFPLPFGELHVAFDRADLRWLGRDLTTFVPVADLEVHGLRARYRRSGLGAPLAASAPSADEANDFVAPHLQVAVTALLHIDDARASLAGPTVRSTLRVYVASDTEAVMIAGRPVPLEVEPTATLAYQLTRSPMWDTELRGFFYNLAHLNEAALIGLRPHRPGRIPVVFIHGTASSPGRWAEMANRLENAPSVNQQYETWVFAYNTGSPIPYSAMLLRDALTETVRRLDPDGTDPGLRQMVLIGHSQGGLLAKMTAIHSGSRLFDAASRRPLESLILSDPTRNLIRHALFVEPLPFVKRVVFIATPHRGSFLTLNRLTSWVTRFITLPLNLASAAREIATNNEDALIGSGPIPTSVDNMNPRNRFLGALQTVPIAPGIPAHSIIAVKGKGPIEDGNDGVVAYSSAHIVGVESELVIRTGHSVQSHPMAIEEVRRILLLHAKGERRSDQGPIGATPPRSP